MRRLAQRRLDGLSKQARHLLVTAAVLGPSFRLEDAAEMLGEPPAALLPDRRARVSILRSAVLPTTNGIDSVRSAR